jgi:hypothetical protein
MLKAPSAIRARTADQSRDRKSLSCTQPIAFVPRSTICLGVDVFQGTKIYGTIDNRRRSRPLVAAYSLRATQCNSIECLNGPRGPLPYHS